MLSIKSVLPNPSARRAFAPFRPRTTRLPRAGPGSPAPDSPAPQLGIGNPTEDQIRDAEHHIPALLDDLSGAVGEQPQLVELIARAIVDEPPLALKEGGIIRDGFHTELDELRAASRSGKDWIAKLQQDEIERTGIPSLKIRFNSVFGYYIEVTKANLDRVPPTYTRKQTVANGERFITPELKEMESKILGAEERTVKLEYDLFLKIREEVLAFVEPIQRAADALAQLDVLSAFAETARLYNYVRPEVGDAVTFEVESRSDGRKQAVNVQRAGVAPSSVIEKRRAASVSRTKTGLGARHLVPLLLVAGIGAVAITV